MSNTEVPCHEIVIPGTFLAEGFSVYLMQIEFGNQHYYYLGMTGDSYYRSARAGFHRLAGHLEYQNKQSTQNQLRAGINSILKPANRADFSKKIKDVYLRMYHFPIPGFEYNDAIKLACDDEAYRHQKSEVANLERALIITLKSKLNKKLFNKTPNKKDPFPLSDVHQVVYDKILSIVNATI